MCKNLDNKRIAILATDGFEQVELTRPLRETAAAGAIVEIVSPKATDIQGFRHDTKADKFKVDRTVGNANAADYEGLILPGGLFNPDALRTNTQCVAFVKDFFEQDKPVAAICHGPWTLIEADVVRQRTLTSWPSLRTDLQNAGAKWVNEPVVNDRGLVSSRNPDDLDAFCEKIIEVFAVG